MVRQKTKQTLQALEKRATLESGRSASRKLARSTRKSTKRFRWGIVVVAALTVFIISWISGIFSWGVKYVECQKPPTSITSPGLWSGSSIGVPQEPGDANYGPGIGKTYTCTAKKDMYPDNSPRR
ncbi:MAG: hypothetical protein H6797_00245 [Candidatus Nomurabacteria bacterium]|nr:MAG: hypothetical protein H6797_00245 [Candidatus Nomurabacteria bacterium]